MTEINTTWEEVVEWFFIFSTIIVVAVVLINWGMTLLDNTKEILKKLHESNTVASEQKREIERLSDTVKSIERKIQ